MAYIVNDNFEKFKDLVSILSSPFINANFFNEKCVVGTSWTSMMNDESESCVLSEDDCLMWNNNNDKLKILFGNTIPMSCGLPDTYNGKPIYHTFSCTLKLGDKFYRFLYESTADENHVVNDGNVANVDENSILANIINQYTTENAMTVINSNFCAADILKIYTSLSDAQKSLLDSVK